MNRQPQRTPSSGAASLAPRPWWSPDLHADRRPLLLARARLASAIRAWFADRGFLEVEPACLQPSPGADPHIGPFETELVDPSGARRRAWLHSSPEFACKKLLAAGETKIFSFGRVFRNGDAGPLHLPEFTLLEWYRAGEPLGRIEEDCAALLELAGGAGGSAELRWRGRRAAIGAPDRLAVDEAFRLHAGVDLAATLRADGSGDLPALAAEARRIGIRTTPDDSWSDLFSKILAEKVEPRLGLGRPLILRSYPLSEASLARRSPDPGARAERFELYACGVELANGFDELVDSAEARRRLEDERGLRARLYGQSGPIDEDFLAALAFMPEASGCALGFDRLVALALGAERLDQVAWTPVEPGPPA